MNLQVDGRLDCFLMMSILHVGIADIHLTKYTLNNHKTAEACFGVQIHHGLSMIAFDHCESNSDSEEYTLSHQGNILILGHNYFWQ
jgi:hypothetical protein